MNDDPHAVDVLYAKVQLEDGSNRLQCLADELNDRLTLTGIMQKSYDRVKLHVTVMNTLFRKEPEGVVFQQKISSREPFDASNILKVRYRNLSSQDNNFLLSAFW
jgi:activating signal cointegrator complex subunit 1